MTEIKFDIGREYHRRSEIHGTYAGQQYGGIATPKDYPVIFLFTSDSGEEYGYKDEFRADGTFWYTGEGTVGDMQMIKGNLAIFEHQDHNKTIHLFEATQQAYVRYVGQATCIGYHKEPRPDKNLNDRNAIVFHLEIDSLPKSPNEAIPHEIDNVNNIKELKSKSLKELRQAALSIPSKSVSNTVRKKITYYRSEAIKEYVQTRSSGKCEGCKMDAPFLTKKKIPYLECHHLNRRSDGGPDHPLNVIALCPNCHRRVHYGQDGVSYNNQLKLIVSRIEKLII